MILGEPNVFYFTGYRGAGGLLDCDGNKVLLAPLLERNRALKVKGIDVKLYYPFKIDDEVIEGNLTTAMKQICKPSPNDQVLVDVGYVPTEIYIQLNSIYNIKNITQEILETRAIKDDQEIEMIKLAQRATAEAMKKAGSSLDKDMTEIELAGLIDMTMRREGAEDYAFPSITAFGENAAEPHHIPTMRSLKSGDTVVVDIGAKYQGYSFDSTRTFLYNCSEKAKKVYETVLEAQLEAIDTVREGVEASTVDKVARSRIERAGYGKYFVHSTGHGVGIEVHENPTISMRSKDLLKEGMVITVEPGIYIENELGVRIEDTLIVRKGKPEVLETVYKAI
ncbi:aminopeptidase P family protein [Metallosphaera cuprina]|nr:aminopeptidase P family protein [Metallosphaera cuprina]